MTDRVEFTGKIRDQAYARAVGKCQKCGVPLSPGKVQYDHILPCALGGDGSLANCMVLCVACHSAKTGKEDVPRIRKADRMRRVHIGAKTAPRNPIKNAGFPKKERTPKPSLQPRILYRDMPK